MGSSIPCALIVKVNFRSLPVIVPPSNGSVPCGDLNIPDTLPPSCLKVTGVVLVPCGDVTVTSQSPVTSGVCAKTGDAMNSESASSVDFKRVIQ